MVLDEEAAREEESEQGHLEEEDKELGQPEVRSSKDPQRPSPEEVKTHNLTHLPYRSWCADCVAGRGQAPAHGKAREDRELPQVGMDYFYMGHRGAAECLPCIAVKDYDSKAIYSHVVQKKGAHGNMVRRVVNDLHNLGHKRLVLKSDQEPALQDLAKAVKENFAGDIIPEVSPVGESQSNGSVEAGIKSVGGMIRTLKSAMERNYKIKLKKEHPIMAWIVEHAGYLLTYYGHGRDGKTPHQLLKGKHIHRPLYQLGEKLRFHPLGLIKGRGKLDSKMIEGIYLGSSRKSAEYYMGTPDGVLRARTVFRVPLEERYDEVALGTFRGMPWNLKPHEDAAEQVMPEAEESGDQVGRKMASDKEVEETGVMRAPRRARLSREEVRAFINKHGASPGCPGCDAVRMNTQARGHTEQCRKRIEATSNESEALRARIAAAGDRQNKYIAGQIEDHDRQQEKKRRREEDYYFNEPNATASNCMPSNTDIVNITPANNDPYMDMSEQPSASSSSSTPAPLPQSDSRMHVESQREKRRADEPPEGEELRGQPAGDPGHDETMGIVRVLNYLGVDSDRLIDKINNMKEATVNMKYLLGIDVSEVYSPSRVVALAEQYGLTPGFSLDIQTQDDEGNPWDFTDPKQRAKAKKLVKDTAPMLLIGSPMCTAFSQLQKFNIERMGIDWYTKKYNDAMIHLKFCTELYREQVNNGRFFLHEHPASATSWHEGIIIDMFQLPGVDRVTGDMCMMGMTTTGSDGEEAAVRKRTGWLSNSQCILNKLAIKCGGSHKHLPLINGRAAAAAVYPEGVCRSILEGLVDELRNHRYINDLELGTSDPEEESFDFDQEFYHYYDDISGKYLDPTLVRAARKEEIEEFTRRKVYIKVQYQSAMHVQEKVQ